MDAISVLKFIKNTVTPDNDEVMFLSVNLEASYIRICHDYCIIPSKSCNFSFDITECSAYRESSRENSVRSEHNLALHSSANLLLDIDY